MYVCARFLRKEKDIAEARFDVVQAESNRLRQQNEHLSKQLTDTTQALSDERDKAQVVMMMNRANIVEWALGP